MKTFKHKTLKGYTARYFQGSYKIFDDRGFQVTIFPKIFVEDSLDWEPLKERISYINCLQKDIGSISVRDADSVLIIENPEDITREILNAIKANEFLTVYSPEEFFYAIKHDTDGTYRMSIKPPQENSSKFYLIKIK